MEKTKEPKAITLIALTITIIVLLILAGVTIATLTGDNGILTRAQDAKNKTEQAEQEEREDLDETEDFINDYLAGIKIEQVTDENPGALEGSGTDTDPYVINSIEDLVFFAYNVRIGNTYEGQTVELGTNLDFNSDKSYINPSRTDYVEYGYDGELKTLLTSGDGFIPIGKYDISTPSDEEVARQSSFEGIFDGNGNVIKNLYINESAENDAEQIGFFATNCGEIRNLGLIDVNIYVNGKSISIGGLTGGTFGNITRCYISGNINCDVTLWSMVGGITGNAKKSLQITECSNRANITCNNLGETGQTVVAGIAGNTASEYVEINKCYNSGNIYGYSENNSVDVGGIVSFFRNGKIMNCYNTGKIEGKGTSTTYLGGILGYSGMNEVENNDIYNCYNTGEIVLDGNISNGRAWIGGIIGQNYKTTLTNVYNTGNITIKGENTNIRVGGIAAGYANGKIYNGYNTGNIIATNTTSDYIGSIEGHKSAEITNCYYLKGTYSKGIGVISEGQIDEGVEEVESISEFPSILSVVNTENAFKEDTNNINNGNPILNWQ